MTSFIDRMSSSAYYGCVALVCTSLGLKFSSTLFSWEGTGISAYDLPFQLLLAMSCLLPGIAAWFVPDVILHMTSVILIGLLLRRAWLVGKGGRSHRNFDAMPLALGYFGLASLFIGTAAVFFSGYFSVGRHIPAGLFFIPATICIPWSFFLCELLSIEGIRKLLHSWRML